MTKIGLAGSIDGGIRFHLKRHAKSARTGSLNARRPGVVSWYDSVLAFCLGGDGLSYHRASRDGDREWHTADQSPINLGEC